MLRFIPCVVALISVLHLQRGVSAFQCPPPSCGTVSCTSTCTVTCYSQLVSALACKAAGTGCGTIVIPSGTTLDLCDTIDLTGPGHNGLVLRINGTLNWIGETSNNPCFRPVMIKITNAQGIVIEGVGTGARLITSIYTPCQEWHGEPGCNPQICDVPSSSAIISIADAINITGNSSDITIQNLNVTRTATAVRFDSSGVHDVSLIDLDIQNIGGYGVFGSCDHGITIQNCHVQGAYGQHGFRFYADDVTIENSSAADTRTGFRMVVGQNFTVDGFTSTGQSTEVGPNPFEGVANERVLNSDVQNVTITGTVAGNEKMQVNLGVIGAWFDNIENDLSSTVSLGPISIQRPLNKVYWGTLSGTANLGTHACVGPNKGHRGCKYDINDDGAVNVDELIAIILNWGECSQITLCTNNQFTDWDCPEDIDPYQGDGTVDVDDLVTVILNWGPCGDPSPEGLPQSIQDCIDKAEQQYGPGSSPEKDVFIERCIFGLCEAGYIDCD